MLDSAILAVSVAFAALLFHPRVAAVRLWRATLTPLASIIGSGFLVLGPLLVVSFGWAAPLAMLALCLTAYLFGEAIRYNIANAETASAMVSVHRIEALASTVLAFSYVISVAYYLNLFGAFGVSLTPFEAPHHARALTSAIFLLILITGLSRGFAALEHLERLSVGVKLAVIAGLLLGLSAHFSTAARDGVMVRNEMAVTGWPALALIAGLIVTVQGFETSRYLGLVYDTGTRIRSMRLAQLLSAVIYLVYTLLLAYIFSRDSITLNETAIIDMMQRVAPVLPALLVVAALSAQFSAALADTSGAGGLAVEISRGWLSDKRAYVLLVAVGLALTWGSDIFDIIAYASRAFAAYYALQAGIAALIAHRLRDRPRTVFYAALTLIGAGMAVFGEALVEG